MWRLFIYSYSFLLRRDAETKLHNEALFYNCDDLCVDCDSTKLPTDKALITPSHTVNNLFCAVDYENYRLWQKWLSGSVRITSKPTGGPSYEQSRFCPPHHGPQIAAPATTTSARHDDVVGKCCNRRKGETFIVSKKGGLKRDGKN